MRRAWIAAAIGLAALLQGVLPADAGEPVKAGHEQAAKAIAAAGDRKWALARRLADNSGHPLAAKIVRWTRLTDDRVRAAFRDYAEFVENEPDWPLRDHLLRRAEAAMITARLPAADILGWFVSHPPVSPDGRIRRAAALLATGDKQAAVKLLRRTWVEDNLAARQERGFYRLYRKYLTREDHLQRLDRLLWDGRFYPVRRMYRRVNPDYRALAEARLALRLFRGGVDRAISRVPEKLLNDPGLIYERLRWRRRKGRNEDARELLADPPATLVRPVKWWRERAVLARRALQAGHITAAYDLARNHQLDGGPGRAEAEWLAGWIALRFLDEAGNALAHFTALYRNVKYPVSRARGAYWAARAAAALGDDKGAQSWYAAAAAHPTTYYGQLAMARAEKTAPFALPADPEIDEAEARRFAANELVKAVELLAAAGHSRKIGPFIRRLYAAQSSPGWWSLVAGLAARSRRPDLAVRTALKAVRAGVNLVRLGYPLLPQRARSGIELPLVLATIRQESAFDAQAVSSAGARGLMQLMPLTARKIAKKLNTGYARRRLTEEPDYNLNLGQAHLGELITDFDGSYILALAAYNAGPGRVKKWLKRYGDPRESAIDAIDWVEQIPFGETRNYVQRVLENLRVYRHRLGATELAFNPLGDLLR